MMLRPARLALVGLLVLLFGPSLSALKNDPVTVNEKIDRITAPPEYDWLRRDEAAVSPSTPGEVQEGDATAKKTAKAGDEGGCDFSPSSSRSPVTRTSRTEPRSCSRGNSDCGGLSVGSCDCTAPVGSCAAPGVGAFSTIGYLLAGIFVALLIGAIVWAVVKRRGSREDETALDADDIQSPGDLRPSQVPKFSVESMMERARSAAEAGNFKHAVGFAYLAGIDHLHRSGIVELRRSTTNMQIVDAVARKNGLRQPTAQLVRIFEDLFFGKRPAREEHWEACRDIVEVAFVKAQVPH